MITKFKLFESKEWFNAIRENDIDAVKKFIEDGIDINIKENNEQHRAGLLWASDFEYIDMIKLLLDNNADVDTQNNNNETPLYRAVYRHNKEIVSLLLDNNADVNILVKDNYTSIILAAMLNYNHILKLLLEYDNSKINNKNVFGRTALLEIVWKESLSFDSDKISKKLFNNITFDTIKILIENGTDVFIKDNEDRCFFDYLNINNLNRIKKDYPEIYEKYMNS